MKTGALQCLSRFSAGKATGGTAVPKILKPQKTNSCKKYRDGQRMYVVKNFPESRRNYILGWTKATDLAKGEKQESSHPEWPSGLLGKKG